MPWFLGNHIVLLNIIHVIQTYLFFNYLITFRLNSLKTENRLTTDHPLQSALEKVRSDSTRNFTLNLFLTRYFLCSTQPNRKSLNSKCWESCKEYMLRLGSKWKEWPLRMLATYPASIVITLCSMLSQVSYQTMTFYFSNESHASFYQEMTRLWSLKISWTVHGMSKWLEPRTWWSRNNWECCNSISIETLNKHFFLILNEIL